MGNWEQVIDRFSSRKPNPRLGGRVEWSATRTEAMGGGTVVRAFCTETTLYSYGHHFVLAHYLGQDSEGRDVFLKNGDRNSPTTNKMIAQTQSRCYGPTVSLSALAAAGLREVTLANIVDWREAPGTCLYRDIRTGTFYREWDDETQTGRIEWTFPEQGQWMPYSRSTGDMYEHGTWHVLGACLIRHGGEDYLCSLDEGRYFVSKLARPGKTVAEAFEGLKPDAVKQAEREGKNVVRQGEWFFVPTGMDDRALATQLDTSKTKLNAQARSTPLPRNGMDSNMHVVKQLVISDGSTRYAKGKVFHRRPDRWESGKAPLTREHKTIDLGNEWHTVLSNTQQAAWSMGGNFD